MREVVIFRTVDAWEFFAFFLTKKFALLALGVSAITIKEKSRTGENIPLVRGNFIFSLSLSFD